MSPDRPPLQLQSYAEIAGQETNGSPEAEACSTMLAWTRSFLMSTHPDLGRDGHVCPFTARGTRLDTLRYGVSLETGAGADAIRHLVRDAYLAFDTIEHPPRMEHYRAVMIGFPQCDGAAGLAALASAQKMLRFKALRQHRMIGLFHQGAEAAGLWNRDFRPLRSPFPIVAIRMLVESDAAFALRNTVLIPSYLNRFRLAGGRRLLAQMMR